MPDVTDDKGDVIGTTDGAPEGFYIPFVALHDRNEVAGADAPEPAPPTTYQTPEV